MIRPFLQNLWWRLFSLAAAAVLWLTFVGSPELVTSLYAPIEYRRTLADLEMSSDGPERVYLEIQGPSARLHAFELGRTRVVLDLREVKSPGEHTFTVEGNSIELPAGLRLVRAVPSQIRMRFEQRLERSVPVRVRFAAPLPPRLEVVRQVSDPQQLRVEGAESRVKEIDYVETDPIVLEHRPGVQDFRVQTFVRDRYARLQSKPSVRVTVELRQR